MGGLPEKFENLELEPQWKEWMAENGPKFAGEPPRKF